MIDYHYWKQPNATENISFSSVIEWSQKSMKDTAAITYAIIEPHHEKAINDQCAQRRLRSVWAFDQSDQSHR